MAIISHRHKLIFLKTRKTAGSSIETAIARYCGKEDLICPPYDARPFGIAEQNNQKKFKELTLNDFGKFISRISKEARKNGKIDRDRATKKLRRIIKSSHTTARDLKKLCDEQVWNDYYKICFERNPFDRLVSLYHWRIRKADHQISFRDFVFLAVKKYKEKQARGERIDFWTNRPFYEIDDEIVVNRVGKFENLEQEMKMLFKLIDVSWDGALPKLKSGYRSQYNYRDYYDIELRQVCEELFSYEINLMGYEF